MHQNEVIKYPWSTYQKWLSKLTFMQIKIVNINARVILKAPDWGIACVLTVGGNLTS